MPMIAPGVATPITASTRLLVSRRGPALSRKDDAAHARALGEVLHAWNRAHAGLFSVFVRVVTDNDWSLALALWHTGSGDKAQRDLLEAASIARLSERKSYLNAVKWALASMATIGEYRNAITHTEMTYEYTQLMPGITAKSSHADKLASARRLDQHWRSVRGDLHAIASYLDGVQLGLWLEMPRPLTRRPRLRFVRSSSASTQKRRNRAKKAAKQRQREASRR